MNQNQPFIQPLSLHQGVQYYLIQDGRQLGQDAISLTMDISGKMLFWW